MATFSGRNARVAVGGFTETLAKTPTPLLATRWQVVLKAGELDTSNFEGLGFVDLVPGLWDADISFDALWGNRANQVVPPASLSGTAPLAVPIGEAPFALALVPIFYPGTFTRIVFFMDSGIAVEPVTGAVIGSNDPAVWDFKNALVCSASHDTTVRGVVTYSVRAKSKVERFLSLPAPFTP